MVLNRSGLHRQQLVQVIWFTEVLKLKNPQCLPRNSHQPRFCTRVRRTRLCSPTVLCSGDFRNTREPAEDLQRTCRGQRETAATSSGSADQYLMKEEKRVALKPCLSLSVLISSSPPFAFGTCSGVFLPFSWKIHPRS